MGLLKFLFRCFMAFNWITLFCQDGLKAKPQATLSKLRFEGYG